MENIFCKHLNLDFDIDLSIIDQFKSEVQQTPKSFRINSIDEQLKNFLNTLQIFTKSPACFYTPPYGNRGLHHIDSMKLDNMVKLNYVIGGKNSVMQWFKFKGSEDSIFRNKTDHGGGYLTFDPSACELIWEEELKSPSLINAGIPHNVANRSDNGRWAISYSLFDMNNMLLQWDQAKNIFKNY